MGAFGNNRCEYGGGTTGSLLGLDIRYMQRRGFLEQPMPVTMRWRRNGDECGSIKVETERDSVVLDYRTLIGDNDWESRRYVVGLDWTACHFGGERAWFRCPAPGCSRRVAILYGGSYFACRHCCGLSYQSQREDYFGRALIKADKIRELLGWEPGVLNGYGTKPKWMRWATFERLIEEHDRNTRQSLVGCARRLNLL